MVTQTKNDLISRLKRLAGERHNGWAAIEEAIAEIENLRYSLNSISASARYAANYEISPFVETQSVGGINCQSDDLNNDRP